MNVDEELLKKAADFTGVHETSQLIESALQAFIEKRAYRLGIELGGSDPEASLDPVEDAAS